MAGIGKFGAKQSYEVGDAVWVKGCPREGVAHIVRLNDGIPKDGHDFTPEKGTYEIQHIGGWGVLQVEVSDLKPAKVTEVAIAQAEADAEQQRQVDAAKRTDSLLERLTKCEPLTIDEDSPASMMGILGGLLTGGAAAIAAGKPDDADLEALRFQDAMAVSMGRSLGYCGAPRTDFAVGERVRVRQGVDEEFWNRKVGQTGTVMEPGFMAIFPVNPGQPRGINVEWDDGTKSSIYVTNLEPE